MEGKVGHERQLLLPGRPRDPRTQLPTRVTVGKRGPKADNLPRSHSEFVAERPPPTPSPTAGLPGSAARGLTVVWALQDQVPCRLGPAILSTGYGDTAWAKMWGGDSQMTTTTVTVHINSGLLEPTMIQMRCSPHPPSLTCTLSLPAHPHPEQGCWEVWCDRLAQ